MNSGNTLHRLFSYLYDACLVLMLACTTQAYAVDVMSDQRLFFSDKQRLLLDMTTAEENNTSAKSASIIIGPQERDHQRQTQPDQAIAPNRVSTQNVQASATLQFNGLVTGKKRIQALINGKPCLSINTTDFDKAESPKPIECPHLKLLPFSLQLHIQTGQIIVQSDNLTRARLSQGDKF